MPWLKYDRHLWCSFPLLCFALVISLSLPVISMFHAVLVWTRVRVARFFGWGFYCHDRVNQCLSFLCTLERLFSALWKLGFNYTYFLPYKEVQRRFGLTEVVIWTLTAELDINRTIVNRGLLKTYARSETSCGRDVLVPKWIAQAISEAIFPTFDAVSGPK